MKSKLHLGRGAAILACAGSLAGTAIVVAPITPAAAATKCGNKMIKIPQENGKPFAYPVKSVEVEGGATCAESVKVITSVVSGKPLAGWKGVSAHYKVSKSLEEEGFFPMEVKKGSKKIKYAGHGG
ncbi:MAG TPA: hypothetical protein VHZ54_11495 [Solirubrobacterales bacterium]|jgi:hypothetical protein|nr:hypothetical protein [Solirubrobacterales bacterium]